MAQYIADPGFELFPLDGVDGWLGIGTGIPAPIIVTDPVQSGLKACRLRWESAQGVNGGRIDSQPVGAGAIGVSPVKFWARRSATLSHADTVLRTILHRTPDPAVQLELNYNDDLTETFQEFDLGAGALNSTDFIAQLLRNPSGPFISTATAFVDSFDLSNPVSDMAVLLAELARNALLKQLQDNLGDELAKIRLERGDSIKLQEVKSWFGYERRPGETARTVDFVSCEVFSPKKGIGFPLWDRQVSQHTSGASPAKPLLSSVQLEVVLYHANRDNVTGADMRARSDRYAAAIMRVIRNDATLGVSGIIVQMPDSEAIVIGPTEKAATSGIEPDEADQVRVRLIAEQQETSDGEGVSSGGVPPVPPLGTEVF